MPRSRPVILIQSVLTTLGILFGASLLVDLVDPRIVGLGSLLVVAVKGGLDFYLNATTTPSAQVLATQPIPGGDVVAGPASNFTTGAAISTDLPVGEITTPPER